VKRVTCTMLTTMLVGVGAAAAQVPEDLRPKVLTGIPSPPVGSRARSPLAVTERLMSFDANADHRISRDELPERMQGLVARGDRNADAALDSDEIHALTIAGSSERTRIVVRIPPSEGLPGVIRDLKLPPAKHERALAIVQASMRHVDDLASGDLDGPMRALLDDEEYENFVAAARRLPMNGQMRIKTPTVDGIVRGLSQASAGR
jgi:hypothetical protein